MRYGVGVKRISGMIAALALLFAQHDVSAAVTCPCDIYATAGTPCVAAYSTVRLMYSTYTGPLYQVKRTSDKTTKDIYPLPGGIVASAASQDSFLGTGAGTIVKLYDQSGKGNWLGVAGGGTETAAADSAANAKGLSLMVSGHKAYALYMVDGNGYRKDTTSGMPTGTLPEGNYYVVDGTRYNGGCCFDFGNAETNNAAGATGTMSTVFFGQGYWGKGAGNGPWFAGDFEAGVWTGGAGAYSTNTADPSITYKYAMGITKTWSNPSSYEIRVADASPTGSINLITAWNGGFTTTWKTQGGIILGIGGDNSQLFEYGTFFEGCITAGKPSDATDSLVHRNIQAAGYGVTTATLDRAPDEATTPLFTVRYNPSTASAFISYTMQDTRRVNVNIFDLQGRQIAAIVSSVISAGRHEAVWNAKSVPTGVYVANMAIEGWNGRSERIIVGR